MDIPKYSIEEDVELFHKIIKDKERSEALRQGAHDELVGLLVGLGDETKFTIH